MFAKAAQKKERKIAYIAPTYQQARDIAWNQLKEVCRPILKQANESRLEIGIATMDGGTSLIVLRGWESVETLRGQRFDFLVIDEIASMRDFWMNWQEVLRPTLTDTKGECLFISTPKGFNHFYDLFNQEGKDKDFKSYHFTTYDNPFIPSEEVDKAKLEMTEDRFAQEYMADFRKTEGLVYKEFSRDRHLFDDAQVLPKMVESLGGVDFGFTNPAAVIHVSKDFDNRYWVTDEWYKKGRTELQVAEYVLTCGFNRVYPDPENPSAIEVLNQKGLSVQEVVKGKGSVESGINRVRELFKQNRLFIHKSCVNLISELETYVYQEKKSNHNEPENPVKENDHACFTKDALIELPIGTIIKQKSNGIKDVYEFMGSKVTADHPYLTQRGFLPLDALRYSDRIVVWKNKLLMEYPLDDTRTQNAASLGVILHLLQRNLLAIKLNASTGMYGKNILVKYPKVFISTTKTVILLITTYLTSKLYHLKNTTKNILIQLGRMGKKILKLQGGMQTNGTDQKQELTSIKNLENFLGKHTPQQKKNVNNVKKNTPLSSPSGASSATIIAKLRHLGKEEVFSTVTTNGFFTVNGVVVSNCDALRYVLMMNAYTEADSESERAERLRMRLQRQVNPTI